MTIGVAIFGEIGAGKDTFAECLKKFRHAMSGYNESCKG